MAGPRAAPLPVVERNRRERNFRICIIRNMTYLTFRRNKR
jgi:hypothetical protein